MVAGVIGNRHLEYGLEHLRIDVSKGESVSRMAKAAGIFAFILQMFRTGEEIGNLSQTLLEASDFYQKELDSREKFNRRPGAYINHNQRFNGFSFSFGRIFTDSEVVGSHETIKFLQASGVLHGYIRFYQAGDDLKKSAEQ